MQHHRLLLLSQAIKNISFYQPIWILPKLQNKTEFDKTGGGGIKISSLKYSEPAKFKSKNNKYET